MRKTFQLSESDLRKVIRKIVLESDLPQHKDVGMYPAIPKYSADSRDVGMYPAVPSSGDGNLDPLALKDLEILSAVEWLEKYPGYNIVDYIK